LSSARRRSEAAGVMLRAAFFALNVGFGRSGRGAGGGRAAVWGDAASALSGVLSVGTTTGNGGLSVWDEDGRGDDVDGWPETQVDADIMA